jgi:hypothetical protein
MLLLRRLRLAAAFFLGLTVAAFAQAVAPTPVVVETAWLAPTVLTAAGDVVLRLNGASSVSLYLSGSPSGLAAVIQSQATSTAAFGGTLALAPVGGGATVTSLTGTGLWNINTGGLFAIRLHATALTSGNVTVAFGGVLGAPQPVVIASGIASTVSQGTPAAVGNAWPVTLAIGGALNAVGNPIFVAPGTGASFAITAASLPLPTGAALDASLTTINAKFGSLGQKNMAGSAPVVMASDQSTLPVAQNASTPVTGTLQNAAVASGNGTPLTVTGHSASVLTVNCAACSGGTTVNFEGSQDGTNFTALSAVQIGTTTIVSSTTTAGLTYWETPVAGLQSLRARVSGYSAGTVTVTATAVPVPWNPKTVNASLVAGTALVGNFGVAQASTTSGQSGPLAQGAVTTAAPSYTTAQTSPLSLDTSGNLRVGGGLTQGLAVSGQLGSLVMGAVTASPPAGYTSGNSNALSLNPAQQLLVNTEGQKATYSFAAGPISNFAASATDGLIITGSGTKTGRVTKLSVCGTATTATTIDVRLLMRTTADSGGTPVSITGFPHDTNNGAVSLTAATYTANPTVNDGTNRIIDVKKLNLGTTGGQAGCLYWQWGDANGQDIVLRGTAQQLALNFNGVTLPTGAIIDYKIEETEE